MGFARVPRKRAPGQRLGPPPTKSERPKYRKTGRVEGQRAVNPHLKQTVEHPTEIPRPHAVHRGCRHHRSLAHAYPAYLRLQTHPRYRVARSADTKRGKNRSKHRDRIGTQRSRLMNLNTASAAIPTHRSALRVNPHDTKRIKDPKQSSATRVR